MTTRHASSTRLDMNGKASNIIVGGGLTYILKQLRLDYGRLHIHSRSKISAPGTFCNFLRKSHFIKDCIYCLLHTGKEQPSQRPCQQHVSHFFNCPFAGTTSLHSCKRSCRRRHLNVQINDIQRQYLPCRARMFVPPYTLEKVFGNDLYHCFGIGIPGT